MTADVERPVGPRAGARRAALAFIYVTIGLDMIALGLVLPILPTLVMQLLNNDAAAAARVYGLFSMAWALMQFIFSPIVGALSDRFGRRPVLLVSNFGLGLDYILMALAPGIGLLFVGRIIAGITAASISTGAAYIADVVPPDKRAGAYGLMSVLFGAGFVFGPMVGGLLAAISPRLPFWVAAGFSLTNAAYGFFILPESLPPEKRGAFLWRRANPLGSLALLRSHTGLLGLAATNFIGQIAHYSLSSMFILYGMYRYGWDQKEEGLYLGAIGLGSAIVGGLLVRPVVAYLGERRALLVGLACGMIGFIIFGLAETNLMFLAGLPMLALWGLADPALQQLMTRHVAASEQGQLQGAGNSTLGIAGLIGPALFTQIFAHFIARPEPWHLAGAPYFLAGLLMLGAIVTAWAATRGTGPVHA
jgi:DHA1 family tetracycline resistance protein-like MFS transporter